MHVGQLQFHNGYYGSSDFEFVRAIRTFLHDHIVSHGSLGLRLGFSSGFTERGVFHHDMLVTDCLSANLWDGVMVKEDECLGFYRKRHRATELLLRGFTLS